MRGQGTEGRKAVDNVPQGTGPNQEDPGRAPQAIQREGLGFGAQPDRASIFWMRRIRSLVA